MRLLRLPRSTLLVRAVRQSAWLTLLLLTACAGSDEEQLNQRVDALALAVEERQVGDIMALLAPEIRGPRDIDKRALRQMLFIQFRRHQQISLTVASRDWRFIDTEQGEAELFAVVLVFGGQGWLPDEARSYGVSSRWRKAKDGDWYLYRVDWDALAGASVL